MRRKHTTSPFYLYSHGPLIGIPFRLRHQIFLFKVTIKRQRKSCYRAFPISGIHLNLEYTWVPQSQILYSKHTYSNIGRPNGCVTPLLEVKDLSIRFGGITALDGVSFSVQEGEMLSIIGPNGAGKTSVFNCITRIYDPNGGAIEFKGQDLLRMRP